MPLDLPPGPVATGLLVSRARRPSLAAHIGLAVLVALVAGLASGGLIAAQRADNSIDRFVRWYRPEDRIVITNPGLQPQDAIAVLDRAGHEREVTARQRFASIVVRSHRIGTHPARGVMVADAPIDPFVADLTRPRVLHGDLADPRRPDEVVIDEDLARLLHLGVGDRFDLDLFPADRIDDIGNGRLVPPSESVPVHVTGVIRRPTDLEHDPESEPGNLAEFQDAFLATTPAFWKAHGKDIAAYGYQQVVRLRSDPGATARFIASFDGRKDSISFPPDVFQDAKVVQRAASTEAITLLVFAALLALVGFVLVGTQVRRVVAVDPLDRETLVSLGVGRNELAVAELVRAAPTVAGGALASVLVAMVVAPRMAFGVSKQAELGGQVGSELAMALLFALVVLVGGMVAVAVSARSAARVDKAPQAPRREGRLLAWMTRRGLPPWSVAGARMAKPPRGRRGAAARSAEVTVCVGVALLVATLTFGANLHRVVTTPSARGWTWDVEVGNFSRKDEASQGRRFLASDPDVANFTGYGAENDISVEGHPIDIMGVDQPTLSELPVIDGRLPAVPGEMALTRHSLRVLGRKVGDDVTVDAALSGPQRLRIVGVTLGPGAIDQTLDLRDGAVVFSSDLAKFIPEDVSVNRYLVRFRSGIDQQAAIARLRPQFGLAVFHSTGTAGIASVRRVQPLLVLFAVVVLVLAGGTLVHALHSAIRRHRRQLAVLKALGHDRRQTGGTVVLQSVTIAARAMIIGVPAGLIVGRWAWTFAASTIGVVQTVSYPLGVVLAVLGVLAAAALAGLPSAGRASRVPVAESLRTE